MKTRSCTLPVNNTASGHGPLWQQYYFKQRVYVAGWLPAFMTKRANLSDILCHVLTQNKKNKPKFRYSSGSRDLYPACCKGNFQHW